MRPLNSIRARMTVGFLLVLAPFLLVTCAILIYLNARSDALQARALLRDTAQQARQALTQPDWRTGLTVISQASVREHGIGLMVGDGHQHILWRSGPPPSPAPQRGSDGDDPNDSGDGRPVIFRRVGPDVLIVYHVGTDLARRRRRDIVELLALSLCTLVATGLGTWAMVGRTLRPLNLLSRQANEASAEALEIQLAPPSPDAEMVELVGTLNGLLGRQAQAAAARGRFYAAASHELRTPLQALSGHLELALSRPRGEAEYREALEEARGQSARLTALVRSLLLLNQLEGARPPQEPTDLTALCGQALTRMESSFAARRLVVQAELPEETRPIRAAPTHAEVLVRNLLENASRYTPEGGRVFVALSDQGDQVRLIVENDGVLPEGEDPQSWLEAFHRRDPARTALTGGNGLGLAICRAICNANGWDLRMQRTPSGVRAVVTCTAA